MNTNIYKNIAASVLIGAVIFVASPVFADDGVYGGGYDAGSYGGGYDTGSYGGGYDTGSYGGGYDTGVYGGGYDTGLYGGGYDAGSYGGGYDSGIYGGGYNSGVYGGGYSGTTYYSPDTTTYYSPDTTTLYSPDTTTLYSPDTTTYYSPDSFAAYENGVGYSYQDYGTSYDSGYSMGGGYSVPSFAFSAPSTYYSNPVVYQQQQQQQQQVIRAGNTTTTNNTCTNNSCNYTDNSISGSYNTNTTVTTVNPVRSGSTQYAVQYVYPQNYNYGYNYNYPTYNNIYCHISASQASVASGQTVYLSWSAPGATSAWLSGVGTVSANSSVAVTPYTTTTYTLTVSGYGGSNTCSASVGVYSPIVYNNTPSVSLTQIPYTGFDFGPVGNAIYWLSLLSFAAAGAYLLVYYRGGMAVLASVAAARKATAAPAKIVQATAKKIEKVIEPVISPLQNLAVSEGEKATTDSMTLVASKNNEAPRIIITRN